MTQTTSTLIASQLLLSRRDIQELRMKDSYALHRVVFSIFENIRSPGDLSKSSGFLYADAGQKEEFRRILILSNRTPKSRVSDRYGLVESREISPSFLQHNKYRFQVITNPVTDNKGKRTPIRHVADIKDWFVNKAPSWGAHIDDQSLNVLSPEIQQIVKPSKVKIIVSQSKISGTLTVSDRESFIHAFEKGIGRSRAFGCGLLQIKPILSTTDQEH